MVEKRKTSHKISHEYKQKAKTRMKNEFSNLSIRANIKIPIIRINRELSGFFIVFKYNF